MARRRNESTEHIWRERLARYRRSGQTVAAFCEDECVSTPSFYAWKRRLASVGVNGQPAGAPLFVPISVSTAADGVRIVLPGGAVVELPAGADAQLLQTCIRAAAHRDDEEHTC